MSQQKKHASNAFSESIPPMDESNHYHDAFGHGDTGLNYGDPSDFEERDHNCFTGNYQIDEAVNDTKSDPSEITTSLDELYEEVGLHETTLSTLHSKLTTLTSQIEAEEALALSLRAKIQLFAQKKVLLRKKTEGDVKLVKRVERTLEKTLVKLRGALNNQDKNQQITTEVKKAGSLSENAPELSEDESILSMTSSLEEQVLEHSAKYAYESNLNITGKDAIAEPINDICNTKFCIEIPLHPDTEGKINWPPSRENDKIKSRIKQFIPIWRTNLPSPSLWNNVDSASLITQLMNISSLEILLERQNLIKQSLLPGDAGWVNEKCIKGTPLDIYRHVDYKHWTNTTTNEYMSPEPPSNENTLDPIAILCPYELGGICADDRCPYQHLSRRPPPNTITLPNGKIFFRYHDLPELRLPPLLAKHDFIATIESAASGKLKSDDTTEENEHNNTDPSHKSYPCPWCAKVSLSTIDLRVHIKQCNPSLTVLDGTKYTAQHVVVNKVSSIGHEACNDTSATLDGSTSTLHEIIVDSSDFTENNDLVHLPTVALNTDEESCDESDEEDRKSLCKGFVFDNQFWWQAWISPLKEVAFNAYNNAMDLLFLVFGFQPICDDSNESKISVLRVLSCSNLDNDHRKHAELQEILIMARAIDFCQICVHIGHHSLALSLLRGIPQFKEREYHNMLIQQALNSIVGITYSRSACDVFCCQVRLVLISEFYRLRFTWFSQNRSLPTAGFLNVLLTFPGDKMTTSASIHDIKRHLSSRIPSQTSLSDNSTKQGWEPFVLCLKLQLEKHIIVPYSYRMTGEEQLAFLLECAQIGFVLQDLVESIADQTFSPLSHVLEPTHLVIQQLTQNPRRKLDRISGNALSSQLLVALILCPVVFGSACSMISRHLLPRRDFPISKRSLLGIDSRTSLDLSTLEKFIADTIKDIRRYGCDETKVGNMESLLSPLHALSVAICVSLGSFDKGQLRLDNALNSKKKSCGLETLSVCSISEILWSQLVHLRMICPSHKHQVNLALNSTIFQDTIAKTNAEISSRLLRNGVNLGELDICGDRPMILATACNNFDRNQWQSLASLPMAKHHLLQDVHNLEFNISNPNIELDGLTFAEFPRSLLIASRTLTRLSLVGCMLNELPYSFGMYLTGLLFLNLSSNKLNEIPSSIGSISSLQILNVSHNNITSLPRSINSCINLEVLDVSYNQLSSIPGDLALHLPQLESFLVEGNPAHKVLDNDHRAKRQKKNTISE